MKKCMYFVVCACLCAALLSLSASAHTTGSFYTSGRSTSMPVVVSLGDSYSAGEGIQPYYGQYESEKFTNEDWIAHRSTLAWPGLLKFNGVQLNTVKALNPCVTDGLHSTSGSEDGSWYFAAVSGAKCGDICLSICLEAAGEDIAIIVHPDNPVSDLTLEQIAAIFTGEITNWGEVGGKDAQIVLIGREAGSGTRDGFESITGTENACAYHQELASTDDVITTVSSNSAAIGYASLASVDDSVKAVFVDNRRQIVVAQNIDDDAYYYDEVTLNYQIDIVKAVQETKDIDYITLTLGGNDVGFVSVLTDAVMNCAIGCTYIDLSGENLVERLVDELAKFHESTGKTLKNTYAEILEQAESATLIVVGYPQLLNLEQIDKSWSISYGEAQAIDSAVHIFDRYISEVVSDLKKAGKDIVFVDVQDAFNGHEAYTRDGSEYINGLTVWGSSENVDTSTLQGIFISSASFHPNEKGAQAYADTVQDVLDELEKERVNGQYEDSVGLESTGRSYYRQALEQLNAAGTVNVDIEQAVHMYIVSDSTKAMTTSNFAASVAVTTDTTTGDVSATGSATLTGSGLDIAYDMTYRDGVAYYDYTKPTVQSVSYEMPFALLQFETIDESALTFDSSKMTLDGNIAVTFTVDKAAVNEYGTQLLPQLIGEGYTVTYDNIEMTAVIDPGSMELKSISMDFDADMVIGNYTASATSEAVYEFAILD